jgi:hypothetical protein
MPVLAGMLARSSEIDWSPPAEAAYANDRKGHRFSPQFQNNTHSHESVVKTREIGSFKNGKRRSPQDAWFERLDPKY